MAAFTRYGLEGLGDIGAGLQQVVGIALDARRRRQAREQQLADEQRRAQAEMAAHRENRAFTAGENEKNRANALEIAKMRMAGRTAGGPQLTPDRMAIAGLTGGAPEMGQEFYTPVAEKRMVSRPAALSMDVGQGLSRTAPMAADGNASNRTKDQFPMYLGVDGLASKNVEESAPTTPEFPKFAPPSLGVDTKSLYRPKVGMFEELSFQRPKTQQELLEVAGRQAAEGMRRKAEFEGNKMTQRQEAATAAQIARETDPALQGPKVSNAAARAGATATARGTASTPFKEQDAVRRDAAKKLDAIRSRLLEKDYKGDLTGRLLREPQDSELLEAGRTLEVLGYKIPDGDREQIREFIVRNLTFGSPIKQQRGR